MKRCLTFFSLALLGTATLTILPACQTWSGKVPATALEVSSGNGDVSYRAADPGEIYVYNESSGNLVYRGNVRAGDLLALDTRGDRVLLNGVPVVERVQLDSGQRYKIYLDRGDTARRPVVQRRVIEETRVNP